LHSIVSSAALFDKCCFHLPHPIKITPILMEDNSVEESVQAQAKPDAADHQWARALEEQGLHQIQFLWSPEDFRSVSEIWNGPHSEDGSELRIEEGIPAGFTPPNLLEKPQLTAPGVDPEFIKEVAKRISH
jgi:Mn-containing catalase